VAYRNFAELKHSPDYNIPPAAEHYTEAGYYSVEEYYPADNNYSVERYFPAEEIHSVEGHSPADKSCPVEGYSPAEGIHSAKGYCSDNIHLPPEFAPEGPFCFVRKKKPRLPEVFRNSHKTSDFLPIPDRKLYNTISLPTFRKEIFILFFTAYIVS
jgi:hypothetical protein